MKNKYIINEKWIKLKYKIIKNKFILDFNFLLHKESLYWKEVDIKLLFSSESILSTPINYIWPATYSEHFTYKKNFIINWYSSRLIINLDEYGIDVTDSQYIDFDINIKLTLDDSLFFDTVIHKETDIKKVGTNYSYN